MSEHLITYEPQLFAAANPQYGNQRYPAGEADCALNGADSSTPRRSISLVRFAERNTATIEIDDIQVSIKIRLDAASLRRLAFQLLDAAHDIEQLPALKRLEIAV